MKLGRLNHIGIATLSEPLPGGEGLGWGLGDALHSQRRTPTPLRLGGTPPSLAAPPLKGRGDVL